MQITRYVRGDNCWLRSKCVPGDKSGERQVAVCKNRLETETNATERELHLRYTLVKSVLCTYNRCTNN